MRFRLPSIRQFAKAQEGLAYLEFAITLPFLLALLMGSIEVTRYIIIAQKLEKTSVTVADLVAQSQEVSNTSLNQLILAAGQVMQPYSFAANAYVIISSVKKNGTSPPVVMWQYRGGGTWTRPSAVGSTGLTATMPGGFTMEDKENVIVTEVFYNYAPLMVGSVLSGNSMYKYSIFKPRLGELSTLGS